MTSICITQRADGGGGTQAKAQACTKALARYACRGLLSILGDSDIFTNVYYSVLKTVRVQPALTSDKELVALLVAQLAEGGRHEAEPRGPEHEFKAHCHIQ